MRLPVAVRFLKLYVPIAAGLTLFFGYFYLYVYRIVESQTIERNQLVLDAVRSDMDAALSAALREVWFLQSEPELITAKSVASPVAGPPTIRLIELQRRLGYYFRNIDLIEEFYILFSGSGLAMNDHLVCTFDQLFNLYLDYAEMNPQESREAFLGRKTLNGYLPAARINTDANTILPPDRVLSVFSTFGTSSDVQGAIVVLIRTESIEAMMRPVDLSHGGYLYIGDAGGKVLVSFAPDGTQDVLEPVGGQFLAARTESSLTGWHYVAVQARKAVFGELVFLRRLLVAVLSAGFLFGLVVSLVPASLDAQFYRRVFSLAFSDNADLAEVRDIRSRVEQRLRALITENTSLRTLTEGHQTFIEQEFMRLLFEGASEYQGYLNKLSFKLGSGSYRVAVLKLVEDSVRIDPRGRQSAGHQSTDRYVAKVMMSRFSPYPVHDERGKHFAMLLPDGSTIPAIENLAQSIAEETHARVVIGLGSTVGDPSHIYRALEEAILAAERIAPGKRVAVYESSEDCDFFFPPQLASRLLTATRAGSAGEADALLTELVEANVNARTLRQSVLRLFLAEIVALLLDAARGVAGTDEDVVDPEEIMDLLRSADPPSELVPRIRRYFYELAQAYDRSKQSHNHHLLASVVDHIKAESEKPTLDLVSVADSFSVSTSYLSRFLKEQTGKTFHTLVEDYRIEKAADLLRTANMSVKRIAAEVGFGSHNSFCRSFKRACGVTPTAFRSLPISTTSSKERSRFR